MRLTPIFLAKASRFTYPIKFTIKAVMKNCMIGSKFLRKANGGKVESPFSWKWASHWKFPILSTILTTIFSEQPWIKYLILVVLSWPFVYFTIICKTQNNLFVKETKQVIYLDVSFEGWKCFNLWNAGKGTIWN